MSDAIGISYFQIDGLIRNRVPFLLFAQAGLDFSKIYRGLEIRHIENHLVPVEIVRGRERVAEMTILSVLKERNFLLDHPMLLICATGVPSQLVGQVLVKHGYTNVYFAENGMNAFMRESENARSI